MTVAEIRVTGVRAETVFCNIIPAGIIGAKINFDYADAMWDGLKKTVVLKGCCTKDIINAGNTVEIPAEVVAKPGVRVTVGVYGVDSENNIAIPTLWANLNVTRHAADPSGDESSDPALPVWAQLQEQIDDLKENGAGGGLIIDSDGEGNVSIRATGSSTITSDGFSNVTEVHEMKTLTLAGEEFNSFQDQQAREDLLKKLPKPEATAKVGQHLRVKSVDEAGNITGLETVDANQDSGGNVDFQTDETLILKDGVLSVNTTNNMEQDNTLPITSAGVFATVGNIEALLKTI